ncbi:hypothetical protein BDN67DRAFT_965471, partial [Paxillus ammoniavirescens]
ESALQPFTNALSKCSCFIRWTTTAFPALPSLSNHRTHTGPSSGNSSRFDSPMPPPLMVVKDLSRTALDLRSECFAHGQLYTALSRVRHQNDSYVSFSNSNEEKDTENAVYKDLHASVPSSM